MTDLIVSETFGPTIQGEGPSTGRIASFVRLGLCNLDCRWCDTPYTWDWTGKNGPPQDRDALVKMSVADVALKVQEIGAPLCVITGGEPMIQQRRLVDLVDLLAEINIEVEVETNGTITPNPRLDVRFNVSPKLPSSGVARRHADLALTVYGIERRAVFKFVVATIEDLAVLDDLVFMHAIDPSRVWVMPEGRTVDEVTAHGARLVDAALARGFNFSTRLHVLLWNDERGR